jgi:hypothetical protein
MWEKCGRWFRGASSVEDRPAGSAPSMGARARPNIVAGVRVCGCAGVRVCGRAGARVCGCAGARARGRAGARARGCAGVPKSRKEGWHTATRERPCDVRTSDDRTDDGENQYRPLPRRRLRGRGVCGQRNRASVPKKDKRSTDERQDSSLQRFCGLQGAMVHFHAGRRKGKAVLLAALATSHLRQSLLIDADHTRPHGARFE